MIRVRGVRIRRLMISAFVACSECVATGVAAQDTSTTHISDARCDSIVAASGGDGVARVVSLRLQAARGGGVASRVFRVVKRVDGGELATAQITDMLLITGAAFVPPIPFRLTVFSGPVMTPSFRRISASAEAVLRSPTLTRAYRAAFGSTGTLASVW